VTWIPTERVAPGIRSKRPRRGKALLGRRSDAAQPVAHLDPSFVDQVANPPLAKKYLLDGERAEPEDQIRISIRAGDELQAALRVP